MGTIDKIIMLLGQKKISQKELADHLGIKKTVITDWKAGRTKSYVYRIKDIADFLGTSVEYLISDDPDFINTEASNPNTQVSEINTYDSTTRDVASRFNRLSLEDKSKVITFILSLENENL